MKIVDADHARLSFVGVPCEPWLMTRPVIRSSSKASDHPQASASAKHKVSGCNHRNDAGKAGVTSGRRS